MNRVSNYVASKGDVEALGRSIQASIEFERRTARAERTATIALSLSVVAVVFAVLRIVL